MTGFIHNPALRHCWFPVAESTDVSGESLISATLLGDKLVIWRSPSGSIVAAPDRCPHREAPLSLGWVTDGVVSCPYHGWAFGDGGRCVRVPSADEGTAIPPAAHLPCITVDERYGLIWACLDKPHFDIPKIPQETEPRFRRINSGVQRWTASATRLTDNFMDISHFPWVHTGTFGDRQKTTVPKLELEDLGDGWFGYQFEVDARNSDDDAQRISGSDDLVVHRHMSTGFTLPLTVRSTIRYEDGLEHILLLCSTPIDDEHCYFTFVVWRNDDFSVDGEEVIAFDRAIGEEDRLMLERVPGSLPLGQTDLASVQADRGSVEWRRQFIKFLERSPA
ncbi:aromatic ring-hydroxylating dioxygenase subunit alpha [Ilumatobacteraceae bacterium]|nr:aromatic ring-hydroxylating dioxygenase subunit alpha [Ilumatobacteraceae bacterium]